MKKRVFGILSAVMMSAVLAAGCGEKDISGQQDTYMEETAERFREAGEGLAGSSGEAGESSAGSSGEAGEGLAGSSEKAGEGLEGNMADAEGGPPGCPAAGGDGLADSSAKDGEFYIYSWDMELGERLEYVYEAYPEMKERVQYVCTSTSSEGFQEEISRLLQDPGAEAYPDMIAMDAGWMMEYTNSDILLPVTDCGITDADLGEMSPYTITIAMDKRDYALKGISWQSSPGAFFYRADLAESLLGVENPEEMQERVGSWEGFLETAREVMEESGGMTKILASDDGIMEIAMFHKARPWVALDGVFHMDDAAFAYMDVIYALEREGLTQEAGQGTERWKNGFADGSVLGYFGGTRFADGSIRPNCGGEAAGQGTYGLWNVCQGPVPYALGGTWLGVTAGCSDTALAGILMKALCCNGEIMAQIAEGTQDYVNNKAVMESLYDGWKGSSGLLGGQNPMEIFASAADGVETFWMCVYDQKINGWLEIQAEAYAAGEKGKDGAVADLKKTVAEALPAVTVE